jgi:hypothetical protein
VGKIARWPMSVHDGTLKGNRPRVTTVGTRRFRVVRIHFALAVKLPGGGWGTFPGEPAGDSRRQGTLPFWMLV